MPSNPVEEHWESLYASKQASQLSWHQDESGVSLELVEKFATASADIVDVGGGDSSLAPSLVARGYHLSVLDVSAKALERAKVRSGVAASQIRWIVGDLTRIESLGNFDVWHDRAVFHFLNEAPDRARYAALLRASLRPDGHAVIATFAPDGPTHCSGLPVQRYDAQGIAAALGGAFRILHEERNTHTTPWGAEQSFQSVVIQRR